MGLKRLLYTKNSQDGLILSFPKIFLLIIYILCILFTFIQFSTAKISDIVVLEPLTTLENRRYAISPNIFGFSAQILSILLILGIFFFILSGDKPLDEQLIQLQRKIQERQVSTIITLTLLSGVLILVILTIIGKFSVESTENLLVEFSYRTNILVLYIWLLIQPTLMLSGAFLLLNLGTREQTDSYQGNRKKAIFFFSEIIFTILLMVIIFLIFGVTLDLRPNPFDVKPFNLVIESVGFFRINLYWLLINLNILLILIILLCIMLFLSDRLRLIESTSFSRNQILFFSSFVVIMPVIVIFFSLPSNIAFSQIVIPFYYIILAFFLFCLSFIYSINKGYISEKYLKIRKNLISWLLFFGVIFLLLKTIPTAIAFTSPTLKTIWNIFDLLGLGVVMFFGIFRVVIIPNGKEKQLHSLRGTHFLKRFTRIPIYSKMIFLLYISFISFYISSESYTVAVLLQIPDFMTNLKLEFLTASFFVGAFYAFWIYRPVPRNSPFYDYVRKKILRHY